MSNPTYRKPLYALCFAVFPLMVCSGIVYSVLTLFIADELGGSTTEIGLIYALGSLTGAIIAPAIGKLSDRIGRRPILIGCMIGFTAMFSLYALVRGVAEVFPIQALEGAVWAALSPAAMAYIAEIVPLEHHGWAMGMYTRTWYLGWVIGPALGGYLGDAIGFRLTFTIGAALMVFGLAATWLYVKEPRKAKQQQKHFRPSAYFF